jgi:ubiquitin C
MYIRITHVQSKICIQRDPFLIDIDPSFTIKQVKETIPQYINVPSCHQFLSFQGRTLDDEHTLASYEGIRDGSTLCMVIFPNVSREKYRVFVSIHISDKEREIIDLDIFYYDTVAEVKHAIFERTSIPTSQQRIIFAGKQIEDERVFSNDGIQKESTVHLIINTDVKI